MGRAEDWDTASMELDDRFLCVAPDLPGHGASLGLPPESYTMDGSARAVLDLLDGLGVRRVTLVGYSMGGRLALYLALRHPERCAKVFLESASPGLSSVGERASRRASDEERAVRLETGDLLEFLRDWYRQPIFASLAKDEGLLRRTVGVKSDNCPEELAKSLRGMGAGSQPSLWGELPELLLPALAVAGDLDSKFAGISHRMADLSPLVRPVVVPGAGHNARAEAPETYLALLGDFLDGP